ncbi:hypothetical protein SCUCBS95973_000521 [Sporothrix curviconia]|uniref:ADP-ribosylation factor n=1 Tax=Sporothrix curviconia TaxID=1260050 RepID=A0ABP0AR25_9PEZI
MASSSSHDPSSGLLSVQSAISSPPLVSSAAPAAPKSSADIRKVFRNFDDPAVYQETVDAAFTTSASNFVVEFGDNKAYIACNLSEDDAVSLLAVPRSPDTPVRWINIWNPSKQRGVVQAIGQRYHFSRRLTRSIWAWDEVRKQLGASKHAHAGHSSQIGRASQTGLGSVHRPSTSATRTLADLEHGLVELAAVGASSTLVSGFEDEAKLASIFAAQNVDGAAAPPPSRQGVAAKNTSLAGDLAVFKMMQDILNYTTIDQEKPFVCIGANWLHTPPKGKTTRSTSLVPPKHWSWFVLCDDRTVISFHEAAHYSKVPKSEDTARWQSEELKSMRSNTFKVFCQLSTCGLGDEYHEFSQLTSVRQPGRGHTHGGADAEGVEGSSNLFYYLFEDYSAAIDILIGSKKALDDISEKILRTAEWKNKEDTTDVIPTLYKLNKELRQLHHLFANYKILINQLLNSNSNSNYPSMEDEWDDNRDSSNRKNNNDNGGGGGSNSNGNSNRNSHGHRLLSVKAANRFRRLQVQLQSLMLDAIQDCLDEKTSLQGTYFSLIAQKDSHSTERLTRSATLLAKLSVFFLPISFMTSYFSVNIPGLLEGYSATTYWASFGVIAGVSFFSLFFFSKVLMFLSERLDHWADGATHWASDKLGIRRKNGTRYREDDNRD